MRRDAQVSAARLDRPGPFTGRRTAVASRNRCDDACVCAWGRPGTRVALPRSVEVATMMRTRLWMLSALAVLPALMGAKGGCGAASKTPAPDVEGVWSIDYDDSLEVEVTIGGAVYTAEIGVEGGAFTI